MRATGMLDWMVAITVSIAASMVGNDTTAAEIASGMP